MRWLVGASIATLVAVLAGALWLSYDYERNRKQDSLRDTVTTAAAGIRTRLRETEKGLLLLNADLDRDDAAARFERGAIEALKANPAMLRLEQRSASGRLLAALDAAPPRPNLAALRPEALRSEVREAMIEARGSGRIAYSRPYIMPITGIPVIELAVHRPGEIGSALLAVISLQLLLDRFVGPDVLSENALRLTLPGGDPLAAASAPTRGAGVYVASAPLQLGSTRLVLQANSIRRLPSVVPNLLTALLVLLSVALAASAGLLWRDTRRRVWAERQMRAQYAFRKAMEDSLVTGLRARDRDGRITYVNPAFCAMTGFDEHELIGSRPPMPYWDPEAREEYEHRQAELQAGRLSRLGVETVFLRKNGERLPVLVFDAPLIDDSGRHTGWMGSILDLSEQKRAEDMNRRHAEKLQSNARMATLGEMASALSHELNQPLAAITSYATACENLVGRGDPEPVLGALERIRQQCERAGQVIRSVNDFVRRRRIERRTVSVAELLSSLDPLIRLQAKKPDVRVAWRAEGGCDVIGDHTMLELVVLNLTRNAIDSMSDVPPECRSLEIVARRVEGGPRPEVEVSVTDRGRGVSPEDEPHLFNPFFSTKTEGMGIGLSLCRSVIEQHHGQLGHVPRDGGGARFWFRVPAAPIQAGSASAPAHMEP
ncbi:MAG: PAS domain-containing sensor histidine kinase [Burkholderiaceae bacterium]